MIFRLTQWKTDGQQRVHGMLPPGGTGCRDWRECRIGLGLGLGMLVGHRPEYFYTLSRHPGALPVLELHPNYQGSWPLTDVTTVNIQKVTFYLPWEANWRIYNKPFVGRGSAPDRGGGAYSAPVAGGERELTAPPNNPTAAVGPRCLSPLFFRHL